MRNYASILVLEDESGASALFSELIGSISTEGADILTTETASCVLRSIVINYITNRDKTFILVSSYAELLEDALYLKRTFEEDVSVGALLLLNEVSEQLRKASYSDLEYLFIYCGSIDTLLRSRSFITKVRGLVSSTGRKRYLVAEVPSLNALDIELLSVISESLEAVPVAVLRGEVGGNIDKLVRVAMKSKEVVKGTYTYRAPFFNYDATVLIKNNVERLVLLTPSPQRGLRVLKFVDAIIAYYEVPRVRSIASLIDSLKRNVSCVLRFMDVTIDEEFLNIVNSLMVTGSIKKTHEELGIPYYVIRRIVQDLKKFETILNCEVVRVSKGGVTRGGVTFTKEGKALINYLSRFYSGLSNYCSESLNDINELSSDEDSLSGDECDVHIFPLPPV